jgi:hypothetical protein
MMTDQGHIDGIGDGKVLSPYYRRRAEEGRKALQEKKEELLARLMETDDPEEKRAIGEELAALPPVIRMMSVDPVSAEDEEGS